MKKLLFIIMTFMASFTVYAQEATANIEEIELTSVASTEIVIATIELDADYVSWNPLTITVPLSLTPNEILYLSGPNMPTVPSQYWSLANGILTINYPAGDLTELPFLEKQYQKIKIYTRSVIYVIELSL